MHIFFLRFRFEYNLIDIKIYKYWQFFGFFFPIFFLKMEEKTFLCTCISCLKENSNSVLLNQNTYNRHHKKQQTREDSLINNSTQVKIIKRRSYRLMIYVKMIYIKRRSYQLMIFVKMIYIKRKSYQLMNLIKILILKALMKIINIILIIVRMIVRMMMIMKKMMMKMIMMVKMTMKMKKKMMMQCKSIIDLTVLVKN